MIVIIAFFFIVAAFGFGYQAGKHDWFLIKQKKKRQ